MLRQNFFKMIRHFKGKTADFDLREKDQGNLFRLLGGDILTVDPVIDFETFSFKTIRRMHQIHSAFAFFQLERTLYD